jgi:hypothetical protein
MLLQYNIHEDVTQINGKVAWWCVFWKYTCFSRRDNSKCFFVFETLRLDPDLVAVNNNYGTLHGRGVINPGGMTVLK